MTTACLYWSTMTVKTSSQMLQSTMITTSSSLPWNILNIKSSKPEVTECACTVTISDVTKRWHSYKFIGIYIWIHCRSCTKQGVALTGRKHDWPATCCPWLHCICECYRWRRQTPATVTSLAPTLCVGGPVIMVLAMRYYYTKFCNVWVKQTYRYTQTDNAFDKY